MFGNAGLEALVSCVHFSWKLVNLARLEPLGAVPRLSLGTRVNEGERGLNGVGVFVSRLR